MRSSRLGTTLISPFCCGWGCTKAELRHHVELILALTLPSSSLCGRCFFAAEPLVIPFGSRWAYFCALGEPLTAALPSGWRHGPARRMWLPCKCPRCRMPTMPTLPRGPKRQCCSYIGSQLTGSGTFTISMRLRRQNPVIIGSTKARTFTCLRTRPRGDVALRSRTIQEQMIRMLLTGVSLPSHAHRSRPRMPAKCAVDTVLDQTHVRYSYRQHCMVSLTVADSVDQSEWHLPTYDPRNENKYHYKLHSLDLYFWTQQDALQFINGVRRVLPPSHVEVLDEPAPPPQPVGMSSVVQKLEDAAISDPQYGASTASSQRTVHDLGLGGGAATVSPEASAAALPPPPPPPANFAPIAYNPAAPAAPEAIRHREKTPPPDEDPLNPLAVAVAYDYQKQPFTPAFPPGVTSPGLPPHGVTSPGLPPPQFAGPPQHPGVHRAATMPVHSGMASPGLASPYGSSFPGPPAPPPSQPASQPTPPVTNSSLPPPPAGGYPNYSYSQQAPARHASQDYSIHQQLYRPSGSEKGSKPPQPYQPKPEGRGRLEENAGKLERGVQGMLKKFEKKFG